MNCAVDRGCCPATGQPENPVTVVVSFRQRVFSSQRWPCPSFLFSPFSLGRASSVCVSSSISDGCMPSSRAFLQWCCLCSPLFPDPAAFFGACFCSAVAVLFRLKGCTLPSLHFLTPGARSVIVDISIFICARSFIAEISVLLSASGIYEKKGFVKKIIAGSQLH